MSKRGRVRAFGAPFDINYSSCSNLKPTLFDWNAYESDIHVYIDYAIINQGHMVPKTISRLKVGWLCESDEIFPDLHDYIKKNHQHIFINNILTTMFILTLIIFLHQTNIFFL